MNFLAQLALSEDEDELHSVLEVELDFRAFQLKILSQRIDLLIKEDEHNEKEEEQ